MPPVKSVAFISPRFADLSEAGGAETLLRALAARLALSGRKVSFLSTCARNHVTWANELPEGSSSVSGMDVHLFHADRVPDRTEFFRIQERISRGAKITPDEERLWLGQGLSSRSMCDWIKKHISEYDRIVCGPYLFGLIQEVASIAPDRTMLVPCLHDEPFARLDSTRRLFASVRACIFNSEPERLLAVSLFGKHAARGAVVGMGIDPFNADPGLFAREHGLSTPYLLYAGRREQLKGTNLLMDYFGTFLTRNKMPLSLVLIGSGRVDIPEGMAQAVIDAGFVTPEEKRNAMAGALAFCHPSTLESLGIVVLESWIAGVPAVVHGLCPVLRHHCLTGNCGLWFRTYPEFEECVLRIATNPAFRAALGNAGRKYVMENYSWKNIDARLIDALERDFNAAAAR